jgi:tight adherence protein C
MILIIVFIILISLFGFCYVKSKDRYKEYSEFIDEKTPFKSLLPIGFYILEVLKLEASRKISSRLYNKINKNLLTRFKELYSINYEKYLSVHKAMVITTVFIVALGGTLLGGAYSLSGDSGKAVQLVDGNLIKKPEIGQGSETVEVEAKIKKGKLSESSRITVNLDEKYYSEKETVKRFSELLNEETIKGNNENLKNIKDKLVLFTGFQGFNSKELWIRWTSSNPEIISNKGSVIRAAVGQGNKNIKIQAELIRRKDSEILVNKDFEVVLLEQEPPTDNRIIEEAKNNIANEVKENNESVIFPKEINGVEGSEIVWNVIKEADTNPLAILIGIIIFCILIFFLLNNEVDKKVKEKQTMIRYDFPEFVNKLVLLINAGMTISSAWDKIVRDDKSNKAIYMELQIVSREIKAGKSEMEAYEDFAMRCRIPEINRFISCILQNLRKGNEELAAILRLQAKECWEMRKNIAKRLGEEASTKLLLPMFIMLVAILLIVIMPAIMQLEGV